MPEHKTDRTRLSEPAHWPDLKDKYRNLAMPHVAGALAAGRRSDTRKRSRDDEAERRKAERN